MNVTMERPEQAALPIDKSASALGLDEFSLLSRIQAGEINAVRGRSGEMMIPQAELEHLARDTVNTQSIADDTTLLPDGSLGIEHHRGLKYRDGRRSSYHISGSDDRFTESEINSYRAASSAIANQLESVKDLNQQLQVEGQLPNSGDFEINTPQTGQWEIRSALLNLNHGEILLCQRGDEFAVIECLDENSPYARAIGPARILWEGNDAHALTESFKDDAKLTLEFMASNLTARAQKIAWERFPDQRPGEVVAAISQRCHQAIANEETISQHQKMDQNNGRGIGI